jgi:hypothetical protein
MTSLLDLKDTEPVKNLQQMIQQFKVNYGLFLDGRSIKPSKQAVFTENGKLNMNLYEGQPLVYFSINDRNSCVNLLKCDFDDNDVKLNESLRPSDICINFPVAEITYTADLSESFSNFTDDDKVTLYQTYGHLFSKKIVIGGKLFIYDLNSAKPEQIDMFKFFLNWTYDSVKYKRETPFNNLSANFFPKMVTSDGEDLNTREKLVNWMKNLYQDRMADIISYNSLVPISQLKFGATSSIDEKLPGITNYKMKLSLNNWVGDSIYTNLTRWVKEFHLFYGLIIDQNSKSEISREIAIDLINFPVIDSSNEFYLEIVKPTTTLEEILINNNIFSTTKDNENISSFPFIKVSDYPNSKDYVLHFFLKCKQYNILLSRDNIKPSEKFKKAIEKALESMKPLICLQNVFNEYGHFFPLNIILGKSLKNTIENSSSLSKKIDLVAPIFESIKSHLKDFNISCLLTQKGNVIEKNDLSDWIQNAKDLEIIEYNNIISLYDILEIEQKKRIDVVLNKQNNYKIIMTGNVDLKDIKIKDIERIKINIEPPLKSENYEVFGSIISKDNLRSDDFLVTFGSYEINEFTATIKALRNATNDMKGCSIMWIIIGDPSKLLVFSPKYRDIKVDYFKESLTLRRYSSTYSIKTIHQLSQGYDISINYSKPINIKLAGWSNNCVYLNISNLSMNFNYDDNIEIAICILQSDHENSKIDISEGIYSGYILTAESKFSEGMIIFVYKYKSFQFLKKRFFFYRIDDKNQCT